SRRVALPSERVELGDDATDCVRAVEDDAAHELVRVEDVAARAVRVMRPYDRLLLAQRPGDLAEGRARRARVAEREHRVAPLEVGDVARQDAKALRVAARIARVARAVPARHDGEAVVAERRGEVLGDRALRERRRDVHGEALAESDRRHVRVDAAGEVGALDEARHGRIVKRRGAQALTATRIGSSAVCAKSPPNATRDASIVSRKMSCARPASMRAPTLRVLRYRSNSRRALVAASEIIEI